MGAKKGISIIGHHIVCDNVVGDMFETFTKESLNNEIAAIYTAIIIFLLMYFGVECEFIIMEMF